MRHFKRDGTVPPLVGGNHLIGDVGYTLNVFGQRDQSLALGFRSDQPPEMHDAVGHDDVAAAEVGPAPAAGERDEQLDADGAVGFALGPGVVRGGERRTRFDRLTIPTTLPSRDDRHPLDAVPFQERRDLGDGRVFGGGDDVGRT